MIGDEGLIGDESDIHSRVADFEAVRVDRLCVEMLCLEMLYLVMLCVVMLDLADLDHLDYFASAVGLIGARRNNNEPVRPSRSPRDGIEVRRPWLVLLLPSCA